ncbi:chemokine-like receptor 1 [Nelusetta ayraudi]|uniref:chemokine-like receptor 1 n=1 Tax=Nelusetta ayraudi TaxID=303726 RepID=UPI003F70B8A0
MDYDYYFSLDYNYTYEDNWTFTEETFFKHTSTCLTDGLCMSLLVFSALVFLLGFFGNALVIWMAGFKMKRTVNTTWYLSLAISDFVFCAFLPFSMANMVMEEWVFGLAMCKIASSVLFLNMFSSIFLLVVISVDRFVSVVFPVWAQNHRSLGKASAVVVLAWLLAMVLSLPSAVFRDVGTHMGHTICFNNYTLSHFSHRAVVLSRFVAGFVVPFFVIMCCYYVIVVKLRSNRMMTKSSRPFRVMSALVAAFFFCWLPYHVFILLELQHHRYDHVILTSGLKVGAAMAAANSFLNPVLYVFMGNDFKQTFKHSVLSKMENAMADEGRTVSRYLSRSSSVDGRASTHI